MVLNEKEIQIKRLEIIENYKELLKYDYDENLIPVIIELKKECKLYNITEYFYLFDIHLADIYINLMNLDDALSIMLKDYDEIDDKQYSDIYISILDRIIYIYITKQYYQTALRFANEKRKYFTNPTNEVINRWYLEMAYIHEALGEKNRSLTELNAILQNNPDEAMKLIVLSNITKLYIDEGNINDALSNLSECFTLSFKLEDKKSEKYCEFLRAKIFRLQKDYNKALIIFNKLFADLTTLDEDNFNFLNEYIILLQETNSLQEAKKTCEKYIDLVDASDDLFNKKLFYENYLRIRSNLITKSKNSLDSLFNKVKELEKQITLNKDSKIDEINDIEMSFDNKEDCNDSIININNLINGFDNMKYDSLRELIMESSKLIENNCFVNELLLIIFSENNVNIIPTYAPETDSIKSYSYKVNRLYERILSYDDLTGTPVEMLLSDLQSLSIDFNDTPAGLLDPITKNTYNELQIKYLYGKVLKEKEDVFGCVLYLSRCNNINERNNKVLLDLSTKVLETKLLNLFKSKNIETQKDLINTALNGLDINMFYQNLKEERMFIPQSLIDVLNYKSTEISFDEFESLVDESDKLKYQEKKLAIKNKKEYKISYHLNIDGCVLSILEQATPYSENANYYFGTICNNDASKSITDFVEVDNVFSKEDLLNDIKLIKSNDTDKCYDFISLKVYFNGYFNNLNFDNINIIKDICDNIKSVIDGKIYLIDDIFVIKTNYKTSVKYVKQIINKLNKLYCFEEKVIKPLIKEVTVSYPKDIKELNDLPELIEYLFNSKDIDLNHKYTEEYYNKYITCKSFNNSIIKAVINDDISLVYSKLTKNNSLLGYLAIPNIKGISEDAELGLADSKIKIKLETKILEEVLKSSLQNVFVNVNIQTLKNILNIYSDSEILQFNKNLSLIIDEFSEPETNILKKLKLLGLNVYINANNIKTLTIEDINNEYVDGVYNVSSESYKYIEMFKDKFELITTNKDYSDDNRIFKNIIVMSGEIIIF